MRLTVLTATIPGREECLKTAMNSVERQTCRSIAHLIRREAPYGASPQHQGHQLNFLLRAVESDYVAVLDDDNWWLPHHAESLLHLAEFTDADVVYSFDRDRHLPRENLNGFARFEICALLAERNRIDGGAAIIRRSALVAAGGFPGDDWGGGYLNEGGSFPSGRNYVDWELWYRLADRGCKFHCFPLPTWVYTTGAHKRMQTGLG